MDGGRLAYRLPLPVIASGHGACALPRPAACELALRALDAVGMLLDPRDWYHRDPTLEQRNLNSS